MQYLIKIIITTVLVIAISETARRNQSIGALLASLPVTSLLAICWFFYETRHSEQTADLCIQILYMVLPSLIFFIVLPFMLYRGLSFPVSLCSACILTAGGYLLLLKSGLATL